MTDEPKLINDARKIVDDLLEQSVLRASDSVAIEPGQLRKIRAVLYLLTWEQVEALAWYERQTQTMQVQQNDPIENVGLTALLADGGERAREVLKAKIPGEKVKEDIHST